MDAILVKFAGLILTGLKLAASSIFARLMIGAGLTYVSFNAAYPQVRSFVESKFLSLAPKAQELLNYTGVTAFMTIVLSAIVARAGLQVFKVATARMDEMMAGTN